MANSRCSTKVLGSTFRMSDPNRSTGPLGHDRIQPHLPLCSPPNPTQTPPSSPPVPYRRGRRRLSPSAIMEGPPLASLSLTHVHYDPSSRLSYACAWLALVPQVLCITYATLIWSTREIEILTMFAGQLACEAFNWILKRYIREERPAQMLGKGYGMPSSHAQFVAFFAVYLGLWVLLRHDPWKANESKTHVPTPMWQRAGLASGGLAGAVAVAQSRMCVLILLGLR